MIVVCLSITNKQVGRNRSYTHLYAFAFGSGLRLFLLSSHNLFFAYILFAFHLLGLFFFFPSFVQFLVICLRWNSCVCPYVSFPSSSSLVKLQKVNANQMNLDRIAHVDHTLNICSFDYHSSLTLFCSVCVCVYVIPKIVFVSIKINNSN